MNKSKLAHVDLAAVETRLLGALAGRTYTVYGSYAGGPSEVIEEALDYADALAVASVKRFDRGWDVWVEET